MILSGSQQWQNAIFAVATLFLLYELWRGWQLGAVRGMLRLAALFCAWIGGSMAAGATGTCVAFFSKVPPLFAPAIAAVSVGLAIYIGISLFSGLLFKKTEHHEGMVRMGFGLGGAFFGVIYGMLFLFGGITLIRGLGALGELRVVQARNEGRSLDTEQKSLFLIRLKESLELGETGRALKGADPLPTAFYDNIVKISMIAGNQQSIERLIQYPAVLELLKNPKVLAFIQDPELQKAADHKNALPLIQNKHLQEIVQDPQILAQMKKINITEALNFALTPSLPEVKAHAVKLKHRVVPPSPSVPVHATNAPSTTPAAP
ncbi:MAG: hypothetical protein WCP60_10855 [bacterium]